MILYSTSFGEARAWYILTPPHMLLATWLALRYLWRREAGWGDLVAIGAVFAGALVPGLSVLAAYAALGSARALVYDTLIGFPQLVSVIVPLPRFDGETASAVGSLLALVVGVELARRGAASRAVARLACWGAAFALPAIVLLAQPSGHPGGIGIAWATMVFRLLPWLPVAVAWTALALLLSDRITSPATAALTCVAVVLLPSLQPIADLPHVLMAIPIFVTLLAVLALAWANQRLPARALAAATVGIVAFVLTVPFVRVAVEQAPALLRGGPGWPRATGVRGESADRTDQLALITYLEHSPPDTRVLVLPSAQMVQVLSGRRSPLEEEDFALYLGAFEEISDASVRQLVDESAAIAKLARDPLLVVLWPNERAAEAIRRSLPLLAAYVDGQFREVARFGRYRVLGRRPAS